MLKISAPYQTIEDRLRAAGVAFDCLEDVSPAIIRAANRDGFPEMRSILLPPQVIRDSLEQPLLRDLLITRIGHAVQLAGHYIPRPEGSLDHILIFCPRGSGWLKIGGRQWNVGLETMVCLPANTPHWYGADPSDPWSNYWIHFSGQQAPDYFRFLGVTVDHPLLHLAGYEPLVAAFEDAWSVMKSVHIWENLVQGSLHLARLLSLLRKHRGETVQRSRDRAEAVGNSMTFMIDNLAAEVSLAELADLAKMSVSRYTVEFRRRNGCSPMEYLNRLRIQKACELLRNSSATIAKIAEEVGFLDPYYFSRAFKKAAGCSPQAFRKGSDGHRRSVPSPA